MELPVGVKECATCGVAWPLASYYPDRRKKDGRKSECRDCHKAKQLKRDRAKAARAAGQGLFQVDVQVQGASNLAALERTLASMAELGSPVPDGEAENLRSMATLADEALKDLARGDSTPRTAMYVLDPYSQALDRLLKRRTGDEGVTHDPIDDLIAQLSTPAMGNPTES